MQGIVKPINNTIMSKKKALINQIKDLREFIALALEKSHNPDVEKILQSALDHSAKFDNH